ncbi:MAG: hypothetical protein BWY82_01986 [Verrucomicrobia bacterium ADurb.Bin474]|nr:MAG: hypothetical protein BWY82_01986 [Verrucomicrobia bacterium ADurb.Bin474]
MGFSRSRQGFEDHASVHCCAGEQLFAPTGSRGHPTDIHIRWIVSLRTQIGLSKFKHPPCKRTVEVMHHFGEPEDRIHAPEFVQHEHVRPVAEVCQLLKIVRNSDLPDDDHRIVSVVEHQIAFGNHTGGWRE